MTFALAVLSLVAAHSTSYVKRTDDFQHGGVYSAGAWEGASVSGGEYKGDFYHYPAYKFEYGVHDPHTHDHKSQWEQRDGDKVTGEYTLDEADGTKRVVSYHADGKTGFHAKVEKIGHAYHKY